MVGVPGFTIALSAPDAAVTVLSGGQVIVGGVMSWTIILWLQILKQPLVSTTVSVRTKFVLQPLPEATLMVWISTDPEIPPMPAMDQA